MRIFLIPAIFVAALFWSPFASADQSSEACVASQPQVDFSKVTGELLATPARVGDELEIGATVSFESVSSSCEISDLTVRVHLPSANGSPSEGLQLGEKLDLPAGSTSFDLEDKLVYTVDLAEGVSQGSFFISWTALLHDGDEDLLISGESPTHQIVVTSPSASLKVVAEPSSGRPPLTVTYRYALTNTSPKLNALAAPSLLPEPESELSTTLNDRTCAPMTYSGVTPPVGFDQVLPGLAGLFPGFTWNFVCSITYTLPGTYDSQPSIIATSSADGRAWPGVSGEATVTVLGSDLIVAKSHQGDFLAGRTGEYQLRVTNRGNQSSTGEVRLADQLPKGLKATAIAGEGWNCKVATLVCRRSDSLGSGLSFPDVILNVKVAAKPPGHVVNTAVVTGGGEPSSATSNNTATDPTRIRNPVQPAQPKSSRFTIKSVKPRANGSTAIVVTVTNAGRLSADDAGSPNLVKRAVRKTTVAGEYVLIVKPTPALRRALKKSKKARKVRLKIAFKAQGIAPSSTVRRIAFRLRPSS